MAFTKMTDDLDIIAKYPDEPYEEEGFTSTAFKASFDQGAKLCKDAINKLVRALNAATAAASLGFRRTANVPADNVQDAIENVQAQLVGAFQEEAVVPNGSISAEKLGTDSVTTPSIENEAVTEPKIKNGSVTYDKVPESGLIEDKTQNTGTHGSFYFTYNDAEYVLGNLFVHVAKSMRMVFFSAVGIYVVTENTGWRTPIDIRVNLERLPAPNGMISANFSFDGILEGAAVKLMNHTEQTADSGDPKVCKITPVFSTEPGRGTFEMTGWYSYSATDDDSEEA